MSTLISHESFTFSRFRHFVFQEHYVQKPIHFSRVKMRLFLSLDAACLFAVEGYIRSRFCRGNINTFAGDQLFNRFRAAINFITLFSTFPLNGGNVREFTRISYFGDVNSLILGTLLDACRRGSCAVNVSALGNIFYL